MSGGIGALLAAVCKTETRDYNVPRDSGNNRSSVKHDIHTIKSSKTSGKFITCICVMLKHTDAP